MSVAGLALSALPLIGVSFALLNINASAVELQSRELQLAVIDDVARTVSATTSNAVSGLSTISALLSDSELSEREAERLALAVLRGSTTLDHVSVYDAEGALVDTLQKGGVPRPPIAPELGQGCMRQAQERELCTQDAISGTADVRIGLAVPLRIAGSLSGYVASRVSLRPLQERIERLSELRFAAQPDSLFVVDHRLRLLAHPDPERALSLEPATPEGFLAGLDPGVLGQPLSMSGDYQGNAQEMVGTLVSLPEQRWAVVAQVPGAVVYASLQRMRTVVGATVALVLVMLVAAALVVGRWVSRPVAELTAFAKHLAARDFEARVHIGSGDEFEFLSNAMSESASQLQASEARVHKEVEIRADLGRYLPAELVDRVIDRRQAMALGGERRNVTVMFADVVAFTPLTERLSPETTVALLNELFTVLTEIVFRNGGTIDKFIGDCVMALWGASEVADAETSRALEAAGEMLSWLETINESFQERYGAEVRLAIGVHAGEAVVGNIGSKTRMEYTAIGDTVNLAAQLESIARPSQILISEAVKDSAGPGFSYVDLGERDLPGRGHPVHLFEVRTVTHAPALAAGDLVAGRYQIEELLGHGGMGEVYRARQLGLRREVAIKIILPRIGAVPGARERFEREARVAALLDHPNAVQIFDFGDDHGRLYMAMELLRGRLLSELIDGGGAMPLQLALPIASSLADVMSAAHSAGLVHRDLKPDNVMIDQGPSGPRARIMDFGLAFMSARAPSDELGRMTRLSQMAGTPDYMSPEQARGLPDVGPPTDVYALGCVIYEMLSGATPHRGEHTADVVVRHLYVDPERLSERVGELALPESLSDFVSSMLTKEPGARPSAAQVLSFLSNFDLDQASSAGLARRHGVGRAARMISEPAPERADTLRTFSEDYVGGRPRIGFAFADPTGQLLMPAVAAGGFRVCFVSQAAELADCDVVVLFPGQGSEVLEAFVASGTPVIAVAPPGDADALTPLLQAGVADVVYTPLKAAAVNQKAWRAVRRAHRGVVPG